MADETERQKKIAAALLELVDRSRERLPHSHGHDLKMLKAYQDVKALVTAPLRR